MGSSVFIKVLIFILNSRRQRIKQSSNQFPVVDLDEVIRREGTFFIDLVVGTLGSMKLEIKIDFFLNFCSVLVSEERSAEKKKRKNKETKAETKEEKKVEKDEKILPEEKNTTSAALPCIDKLRDELSCAV